MVTLFRILDLFTCLHDSYKLTRVVCPIDVESCPLNCSTGALMVGNNPLKCSIGAFTVGLF